MKEKRKTPRVKHESDVTITVVSGSRYPRVIYDGSKDISESGARIHSHIFFPVDSLLRIDFTLETIRQMITLLGKVKWIKIIFQNEEYEAGVEFVDTPEEAVSKLRDYISLKMEFGE